MRCREHDLCKKVKIQASNLDDLYFYSIECPWCGWSITLGNIGHWCSNCYIKFIIEKNYVHFSKSFKKSFSEAFAIAAAKCGGVAIGESTIDRDS